MLECASATVVKRILSLNRFSFGSFHLLIDSWTKMAGRSRVAWNSNCTWVAVKGIPLHLRSTALARCIGEVCGEFIDLADGADLSSMRVKVRIRGCLPEVIPISIGEESFPVNIVPDVNFPLTSAGSRDRCFADSLSRKGKAIALSPLAEAGTSELPSDETQSPAIRVVGECSSSKADSPTKSNQWIMLTRQKSACQTIAPIFEMGQQGMGLGFRNSESEESECLVTAERFDESGFSVEAPFLGLKLTPSGLQVGNSFLLWDFGGWAKAHETSILSLVGLGLFGSKEVNFTLERERAFEVSGLIDLIRWSDSFSSLQNCRLEGCQTQQISVLEPQLVPTSSQHQLENSAHSLKSFVCNADSLGQVTEESVKVAIEDVLLCEAVQKVASVIKLESQGSLEKGVKAAVEVCREVGRRRSCSTPLSRTERELKKLGAAPDFLSTTQKSRRGDRCAISSKLVDEF
ncbi:hypothetical protein LINPERHAP1_LOCUS25783 [Linum perenne]